MLELIAVPQRGMPYVQMGFRIVLYISNLFSSDSFDFLPMIQYMRWSCNQSCFLSVNMCCGYNMNELIDCWYLRLCTNELIDCWYLRLCTCTRPVHVHRRVLTWQAMSHVYCKQHSHACKKGSMQDTAKRESSYSRTKLTYVRIKLLVVNLCCGFLNTLSWGHELNGAWTAQRFSKSLLQTSKST
jgi:hypothetical protein